MRASVKSALVGFVALASVAAGVGSAQAKMPHPPFWGPGLVIGLAGAAIAADVAAQDCWRWQPVYDAYGNYIGRRRVNVCE